MGGGACGWLGHEGGALLRGVSGLGEGPPGLPNQVWTHPEACSPREGPCPLCWLLVTEGWPWQSSHGPWPPPPGCASMSLVSVPPGLRCCIKAPEQTTPDATSGGTEPVPHVRLARSPTAHPATAKDSLVTPHTALSHPLYAQQSSSRSLPKRSDHTCQPETCMQAAALVRTIPNRTIQIPSHRWTHCAPHGDMFLSEREGSAPDRGSSMDHSGKGDAP